MLLTGDTSVDNLSIETVSMLKYKELGDDEAWKVPLAHELMELKENSELVPAGWNREEIDDIKHLYRLTDQNMLVC